VSDKKVCRLFAILFTLMCVGTLVNSIDVTTCYNDWNNYYCQTEDASLLPIFTALYNALQDNLSTIVCRGYYGGHQIEADVTYTSSAIVVNISIQDGYYPDMKCVSNSKAYNGKYVSGTTAYDGYRAITGGNYTYLWDSTEAI